MKNSLCDLNDHLFAALEALDDDSLQGEELDRVIKKSEAITRVATVIIDNANMQIRALDLMYDKGYKQKLPPMLAPKDKEGKEIEIS